MASRSHEFPVAHDIDPDEVADLLRNIAHGIEEGKVPLHGVSSTTEVETRGSDAITCELTLTYRPDGEILIPGHRLARGLDDA